MIPEDARYESKRSGEKQPDPIGEKYLNLGNEGFSSIRHSEYIDKSGLIAFVNCCLNTPQKLICVSRQRRFGKSFVTKML